MTRAQFLMLMTASLIPGAALADAAPDWPEDTMGMYVHMTARGAVVDRVDAETAAAVAGVRVGDVLLTVNGEDVRRFDVRQIRRLGRGFARDATVTLRRGRRILTVRIVRPAYVRPPDWRP